MTDLQQRQALVNLGPWLERCEAAGVPYVPAGWSEPFPAAELYRACETIERGDGVLAGRVPAVYAALKWLDHQRKAADADDRRRMMARWECCSSEEMKYHMSKGDGWDAGMMDLGLDDPRLFDCLASDTLRICVRPWVEAMRIDGYPVEFRVFYGPDGWQGTSSYYPQRPLKDPDAVDWMVCVCEDYAAAIVEAGGFPVGCSMDFLVSEDQRVLFLEGGPPHVLGPVSAHPRCFPPGKVRGLALAMMEGAVK